jgi:N4-gp56 family major capsid protein
MAISTTSTTAQAISAYWHKMALNKLEAETPFYNLGWKDTVVPGGQGKAITWVRFPLAAASLSAATEGVPVTPTTLTAANLTATLVQYVSAVSFSDILQEETFVEGGMEEQAATYIAQQLRYTINGLILAELDASTVTAGGNLLAPLTVVAGTIIGITASDTLTAADLRRARARLANANVPKWKGDKYAFVIHTAVEFDVRSQSAAGSYLDLQKYTESGIKDIKTGLVGDIFGLSIYSSSLNTTGADGAGGLTVYYNYAFGDQAVGVAELRGKRMQIIRKKGGNPGNTYDLADQIGGAVAYNTVFVAKNLSEGTSSALSRVIRYGAASAL